MPKTAKYRCLLKWTHRKWGPQFEKGAAEGTSIRRAANHFLLSFFSSSPNRRRGAIADAHKSLTLEIWREKPPRAVSKTT
jgi:hypothetical protein